MSRKRGGGTKSSNRKGRGAAGPPSQASPYPAHEAIESYVAGLQASEVEFHCNTFLFLASAAAGKNVKLSLTTGGGVEGVLHICPSCNQQPVRFVIKAARPHAPFQCEPGSTVVIDMQHIYKIMVPSLTLTTSLRADGFGTDAEIGGKSIVRMNRALESIDGAWLAPETAADMGLEDESGKGKRWDQFTTNETLFNVKSSFDENLYTTRLDKTKFTLEQEAEAARLAREIEGHRSSNVHVNIERGFEDEGDDEEELFSGVMRETNGSAKGKYRPPAVRNQAPNSQPPRRSSPVTDSHLTTNTKAEAAPNPNPNPNPAPNPTNTTPNPEPNTIADPNPNPNPKEAVLHPIEKEMDKPVEQVVVESAGEAETETVNEDPEDADAKDSSEPLSDVTSTEDTSGPAKSKLNPMAKEFVFNPGAKEFTPTTVTPPFTIHSPDQLPPVPEPMQQFPQMQHMGMNMNQPGMHKHKWPYNAGMHMGMEGAFVQPYEAQYYDIEGMDPMLMQQPMFSYYPHAQFPPHMAQAAHGHPHIPVDPHMPTHMPFAPYMPHPMVGVMPGPGAGLGMANSPPYPMSPQNMSITSSSSSPRPQTYYAEEGSRRGGRGRHSHMRRGQQRR